MVLFKISPPAWLDNAIDVLSKTDEGKLAVEHSFVVWYFDSFSLVKLSTELRHTGPSPLSEFTDKFDFCKEFCTQVYADTTVLENKEFRGLIFSIY